jgi:hypothetical protein
MQISRKAALAAMTAAALAGASVPAVSALGRDHAAGHGGKGKSQSGTSVLSATLAPTVPAPADPPVHGVLPGGVPWQLKSGSVNLRHNGRVRVGYAGW